MGFATTALNDALDGMDLALVSLHSADPSTDGANYITAGGKQAATFNAASGGARCLNADVEFSGMSGSQTVTHFGIWETGGSTFVCGAALTGDQAANAAGEYTLKGDPGGTKTKVTAAEAA